MSVIGNAFDHEWHGKWLETEDGETTGVGNPSYDPSRPYVPRSQRPEWVVVALLGQVQVLRGQPVSVSWVLLRPYNEKHNLWLIR